MSTTGNKRGHALNSEARKCVLKVRNFFEEEKENGGSLIPVRCVLRRTAKACGVSVSTVSKIAKESTKGILTSPGKHRTRDKPVTNLDDFAKSAIRRHVYEYYARRELPTLNKLLRTLRENSLFEGGKTSLSIVLREVGFRFKKINKRKVLMEKADIAILRCQFLRRVKNIDWGKAVFLDETWVNANHSVQYGWTDDSAKGTLNAPTGQGNRLIVSHAGSAEGFVENALLLFTSKKTGDYHEEMDGDCFKEWFLNQLLPNIPPNSVIIMDNAPYHSVQLNKAPTTATRKADIISWLQSNAISYSDDMLKTELLSIVKEHKAKTRLYEIDELAKQAGKYRFLI